MTRIDPETATDERTTLTQFVDYFRETVLLKVDGLTDEQARTAGVPPSDLNLLGLVRHLADVERYWWRCVLEGEPDEPLFYGAAHPAGDPDGDHHPGPDDTLADALLALRAEAAHGRDIASTADLDAQSVGGRRSTRFNVRWILVHLIEEYARHCGHADLLRERIDGVTGD